ncbi:MAG: molybdenum cofactor biosynthesis protein MoaE [Oligoflexales bacterium]|nr:molybdenum cofactor biosynthesis protein MoaE [Oligoflexales bacterium]
MFTEFEITHDCIDTEKYKHRFEQDSCGASVSFLGQVRNTNDGQEVSALEYEIFEELAVKEGLQIMMETREKFPILQAYAVHRHGLLQIQDCAVFIRVSSQHREDAFAACRYIIDQIKKRLPIWKKEYYTNLSAQWVFCQH